MLLYLTMTLSFSQVHHQIDQNVKCIIIMRIEAISFQIYYILREIVENNFPFPPGIWASKGVHFVVLRLDALLAKSLTVITATCEPIKAHPFQIIIKRV